MSWNMTLRKELPSPREIRKMYSLTDEGGARKALIDAEIKSIFEGRSDRMLLVIGPCSADREDSVMDYLGRLATLREKVEDKFLIVPRVYSNKPRTTCEGYKGMLHQPDPQSGPDLYKGLLSIRKLHLDALEQYGFSCADEMLYPENQVYVSDLLSYVTVGARSVENQQHRLVSSGIDVPVGMKNPTGGNLGVMLNSIKAAQEGHHFIYRNYEVRTGGNPWCHAVLRGFVDNGGRMHPNCGYEDLLHIAQKIRTSGVVNPAVIVDCNHCNSGKDCFAQGSVARDVLGSMRRSSEVGGLVKGLMIESYIEDGCQNPDGTVYGQSITDPCLGWEKTERLVLDLADFL